jgi:hypothetical protein
MRFLGIDQDRWNFINSFAPWLSAVGTLAAVFMSLYLAFADRTKLRIRTFRSKYSVDLKMVPLAEGRHLVLTNAEEFFITFIVTNSRGGGATFVESLYWRINDEKIEQRLDLKRYGSHLDDPSAPSIPGLIREIPARISFYSVEFEEVQLPHLKRLLLESKRPVRVGVRTSTGKEFESRVDESLEAWLRKVITSTSASSN